MKDTRLKMVEGQVRLDQLSFLSTIQLIITESEEADNIKGFGSGFFLMHNDNTYFVTADHLVHLKDHDSANETGQRLGIDLIPQIITNIKVKDQLASVTIPTSGYYYLTGYQIGREDFETDKDFLQGILKVLNNKVDINDESLPLGARIADFVDIAITEIKQPLKCLPLNNKVVDFEKNVIIEEGTPKIFLCTSSIADIDDKHTYIVSGTINNDLKNSCTIYRENVCHNGLQFTEVDTDGNVLLKTPETPNILHWEGLSGAPVFNDEGFLVGMLLRGPVSDNIITIAPVKKILNFIEQINLQNEVGDHS